MKYLPYNKESQKELKTNISLIAGSKVKVRKIRIGYIIQIPIKVDLSNETLLKLVQYLDSKSIVNTLRPNVKCEDYLKSHPNAFSTSFQVAFLA